MKKQISKLIIVAMSMAIMCSCEQQQNEDVVKAPNTDGSIETVLKVNHSEKYDVLTTQHTVWVKGTVARVYTTSDTLPSLGTTNQVGENSEGETKNVTVPKNYELYITVK
jgi:hypothetical protein